MPTAPPDHKITIMTRMFQDAIADTDMEELETLMKRYKLAVETQIDFFDFDCTQLVSSNANSPTKTVLPKYVLKDVNIMVSLCKHSDQAPSITVSKVSFDKCVPLVKTLNIFSKSIGIQYDSGCQLSLISKSSLHILLADSYTTGGSSRIRVLTYAGEGKILITTAVKLKVNGNMLNLHTIEEDLNSGSAFSFPTPNRWKAYTGERITSYSGKISILLGGANHKVFPLEVERDLWGVALYRSKLSHKSLNLWTCQPGDYHLV